MQADSRTATRWHQDSALVPFAYGFRPFFLAALFHALLAIAVWLAIRAAGILPLPNMPPQLWHGHEMLFGFVGAAIAGFLLTAIPSWTATRGFAGAPLIAVTMVWLAGRIAFGLAPWLGPAVLAVAELAFLPALIVLVAPPLLRARNRNTPLLIVIVVLWLIDAGFLYALQRQDVALASRTLLIALDVVLLLITVIGGRIVPAFTAGALRKRGVTVEFRSTRWIDVGVIAAMALVVAGDALLDNPVAVGVLAGIAAAVQGIRLAHWHGLRTLAEPIVWVLHLAYAWLPVGLALKAIHLRTGMAWSANWLHALAIGAAGMMIVGMITRVALGHTGRPLVVARSIALAYGILGAAALVRVFGPALAPAYREWSIWSAGALWMIALVLVIRGYTRILVRPRVDGKPG